MTIIDRINAIPSDKLLHFIGGQIIFAVAFWLTASALTGHIVTLLVGVAKEAADEWLRLRALRAGREPKTHMDPWDALATYAGAPYMHAVAVLL
jgi:hypothetical protein